MHCLAVNDIAFSVAGLGMLRGGLRIQATYEAVSPSRVVISFQSASLVCLRWFEEFPTSRASLCLAPGRSSNQASDGRLCS